MASAVIPILMYHQIDDPPQSGTPLRGLVVSPRSFAWQMRILAMLGFRGLSMVDLLPYLRGERVGRVVGITFDDGYRNNVEHALPVLARHGFTATCYIVAHAIGGTNRWDSSIGVPTKALMDERDLLAWHAAGMEIGSHTLDHVDLNTMDDISAGNQIAASRLELEDRLGAPVRHFCYPYGRYSARDVGLVRAAGYHTATTTNRGRACAGDDLLQLRRVLVARASHTGYFLAKILTAYEDRPR